MGATVLHTSTHDDGHPDWRPLPELLAASDVVSLHLPLTAGTRHLLDRETHRLHETPCACWSTRREAPSSTRMRWWPRCGTDGWPPRAWTFSKLEPVAPDNPLLGLDNVVLTPHVTWSTADTMRRYLTEAVANCRRLRDGQPAAHVVNQPPGC